MTSNRMAHPLLLSLANIDSDIRSKGSLRGFVLLTLLPVASFIHKKSRIRTLLSDRCHAPNRFGTVNMEDNVNIK